MAHILEEPTSGMRPEQEKKGLAKAIEEGKVEQHYIVNPKGKEDDELSCLGVGGLALQLQEYAGTD